MIRERWINDDCSVEDPHNLHCFNYLRQSLMCNADTQLQRLGDYVDADESLPHVCRDYNAILHWVEENRWGEFWNWHAMHGNLHEQTEDT